MLVCYISYKKCLRNGLSVNRFSHNHPTSKQKLSYFNGLFSHNAVCVVNCSTVHIRRITSIYQPTNAHIISHKTPLKHFKHFKTLRHVSILSDHHQGALFLAKVIFQYSQFNSYLQTRCCGSISCCVVEQWLGLRRKTHT